MQRFQEIKNNCCFKKPISIGDFSLIIKILLNITLIPEIVYYFLI